MERQEAVKQISELTQQAYELIRQAQVIANEAEVDFCFDVAYGMGGTYSGEDGEWYPSSQGC